ncbi:unnamed protein product [Peronospora belbahrii]|uniref:Uncharacterized protein n=1 Tax=Peronospora belbahrii TaxID=622444 RepID=A0AAU9KU01_9STRA|nr:unnamed protein product [Peronospora belbahrii]CAH0518786.1 unnamed protein product [Peronospora belbahrii]
MRRRLCQSEGHRADIIVQDITCNYMMLSLKLKQITLQSTRITLQTIPVSQQVSFYQLDKVIRFVLDSIAKRWIGRKTERKPLPSSFRTTCTRLHWAAKISSTLKSSQQSLWSRISSQPGCFRMRSS